LKAVLLPRNSTFGACACRSLRLKTVSPTIRWNSTSKQDSRKQHLDCFQSHIVILSLSGAVSMHLNIVQFSHFEHQFVILPIHIGKTPYIGPRDDTQVKDEVTHRSSMKRLAGRQRQWVKDEVTYRSTITRLAGRQRQWLTIPVHPIMPHMSVISPLKLDMHSTRSSELVCQRNFFVAMFVGLQFAHSVLSCSVHVMCLHDSTHSLSTHSLDNLPPQT
jgi:hypothetical protein